MYLNVLGRRSDGYHLLDSLMAFIDIYDDISINPSSGFAINIVGDYAHMVTQDSTNIIYKTADIFGKITNNALDISIDLQKNIPVGAGLGGGSADAAATLLILNKLWEVNFSIEELIEIGIKIGADVPFFLYGKPAFIWDIGKIKKVADLPELYATIIYPNKAISTARVFNVFDQQNGSLNKADEIGDIDISAENMVNLGNHLEKAAISIMPEIKEVLAFLAANKKSLFARMSGSGSTCFAIFDNVKDALEASNLAKNKYPDYYVRQVRVF